MVAAVRSEVVVMLVMAWGVQRLKCKLHTPPHWMFLEGEREGGGVGESGEGASQLTGSGWGV